MELEEYSWALDASEEACLARLLGTPIYWVYAARLLVVDAQVLAPAVYIPLEDGETLIAVESERLETPGEFIDAWRFRVRACSAIDGLRPASLVLLENVSAVSMEVVVRVESIGVVRTTMWGDTEGVSFDAALVLGGPSQPCLRVGHGPVSYWGVSVDPRANFVPDTFAKHLRAPSHPRPSSGA